jgi:hypothetical protein
MEMYHRLLMKFSEILSCLKGGKLNTLGQGDEAKFTYRFVIYRSLKSIVPLTVDYEIRTIVK